ncbi:MAG: hypothetical protein ABFS35_16270 [Bacteroidota bacterium]
MFSVKIFLIITILLLTGIKLKANDGAYDIGPQGGSVYPINNENIQMLEELVVYDQVEGAFTTTFIFTNTSDTIQKVIFGFPVWPSYNSEAYYDEGHEKNKINKQQQIDEIKKTLQFRTWIDGKLISRKLWATDTIDDYKFAFVTTVIFKPKESKKVVNKFKQGFGYGGDNMGRSWRNIKYILKSGTGWKGVIKKVKIVFKMNKEKNIALTSSSGISKEFLLGLDNYYGYRLIRSKDGWTFSPKPTSISYEKNIVTWEFKNLEPNFDISLTNTERDFEILCRFSFLEYLDTLSSYIILNDTLGFSKYYKKIKLQKDLFSVKKDYCKIFYNEYGNIFLKEHIFDNYSKFTHQTRHIINAYAALNDYKFKNEMWLKMFKLFDWYEPTIKVPKYSLYQAEIIDSLLLFEKGQLIIPVTEGDSLADNTALNVSENKIVSLNIKKNNQSFSYLIIVVLIILPVLLLILYFKNRNKPYK